MDFGDQYLTYKEYIKLGGTELEQIPFNLLEFNARKEIDKRTQCRLQNVDDVPDEVRFCMFHLINKMMAYDKKLTDINKRAIASENIDGYSVSYVADSQIAEILKSKNQELNNIIKNDLFGVIVDDEHLLYLGVK